MILEIAACVVGAGGLVLFGIHMDRCRVKEDQQRALREEQDAEPYKSAAIIRFRLDGKEIVVNQCWKYFPYPTYYEVVVDGSVQYTDQSEDQVMRIIGRLLDGRFWESVTMVEA